MEEVERKVAGAFLWIMKFLAVTILPALMLWPIKIWYLRTHYTIGFKLTLIGSAPQLASFFCGVGFITYSAIKKAREIVRKNSVAS